MATTLGTDLYATLGVDSSASAQEITFAFRSRAKEMHPDRHPGDVEVAERYKALTHAYNVLARPTSREAYDRRRVTSTAAPTTAAPSHRHEPVFKTPGRARAAIWSGIGLLTLGVAGSVLLANVDTGDSGKTITLWIVVVKLVICGAVLAAVGAWRLRRLTETSR